MRASLQAAPLPSSANSLASTQDFRVLWPFNLTTATYLTYCLQPLQMSARISSPISPNEPTSSAWATQLQANQADIADLNRRLQSLDLRVRVLEAERSGAQQALWHYHRAARDSQRLRSLISPWAFMSAKLDLIRSRVSLTFTRLENLLTTLQQAWPGCAAYFTPAALDVPNSFEQIACLRMLEKY